MSFNKIRIRDDDVLVHSTSFPGRAFQRFKGFHNTVMIDPVHFEHVVAILVTEIQEFPECIEFVKAETAAGRMRPEVHGFRHVDYAKLPYNQVVEELRRCRSFIADRLGHTPTIWYSPWGAGADSKGAFLHEAAMEAGLSLVTCANMITPGELVKDVRLAKNGGMTNQQLLDRWEGKEILRHWWEGTGALQESITYFKGLP